MHVAEVLSSTPGVPQGQAPTLKQDFRALAPSLQHRSDILICLAAVPGHFAAGWGFPPLPLGSKAGRRVQPRIISTHSFARALSVIRGK